MKKLLVLSSTYPRYKDDPEPQFVHELSRRLASGFDVHVLCPHSSSAASFEKLDEVNVYRYKYAPERFETLVLDGGILANLKKNPLKWLLVPMFLVSQIISTYRLIKKIAPDCLHVHWIIPQGVVIFILGLFIKLPPFLLTSHGGDIYSFKKNKVMRFLKKKIIEKASGVTLVNEVFKDQLKYLNVNQSSVSVIPMGVDLEKFSVGDSNRDPNNLLFVGRLVEKKGVFYLIEAVKRIRQYNPKVRLDIIGYGPDEKRIIEKIKDDSLEGIINFLGPKAQSELPYYYRSCGIFVAPFIEAKSGDQDGFPVALMEAIFCGAPIVSTNMQQIRFALGENASCVCCDSGSAESLGEKILEVQTNYAKYRSIQSKIRLSLTARLDWSNVSKQYLELLQSI